MLDHAPLPGLDLRRHRHPGRQIDQLVIDLHLRAVEMAVTAESSSWPAGSLVSAGPPLLASPDLSEGIALTPQHEA
jgi:hypothetical protein